uniref:CD48 antigen-like isoform X2 n=1 Tax=Scatophagus argus TaxID=75038 RepID=UPI001ED7E2C1|nr:CD48 antigen-like isoform X2 [Scatophagus argus]
MERILLVFAIFLECLSQLQGSSAVTPVCLFVKEGQDLLLNVTITDSDEKPFVFWNFNQTSSIVSFYPGGNSVSPLYKGRIEFSVNSYSVKLKNVQKADSGVYSVRVKGATEKIQAEYNVSVQGRVSPVNLSVDSLSWSSDSCNFTVTCTARDSHINSTFRCDNQTKTCSQDGGKQSKLTSSGASLHVHLENELITCHHSNQVSSANDSKPPEHFCYQSDDITQGSSTGTVVIIIVAVIVVLLIIYFIRYLCKRKREDTQGVYDVPQVDPAVQPLRQSQTHDSSGISPTSTYCLVGPHSGSSGSRGKSLPESLYDQNTNDASCTSPTSTYSLVGPHSGGSGTQGKSGPESLYAQVGRPARS